MTVTVDEVLHDLQKSLAVPKLHYNGHHKFYHRKCEDILEAVKKLLPKGVTVTLFDEMVNIGDRFYVKATAAISYKDKMIQAQAYAREPLAQKGMSESQITGATSSYARKYALGALFLIDDSEDADTKDNRDTPSPLLQQFLKMINDKNIGVDLQNKWKQHFNVKEFSELNNDTIHRLIAKMKEAD